MGFQRREAGKRGAEERTLAGRARRRLVKLQRVGVGGEASAACVDAVVAVAHRFRDVGGDHVPGTCCTCSWPERGGAGLSVLLTKALQLD